VLCKSIHRGRQSITYIRGFGALPAFLSPHGSLCGDFFPSCCFFWSACSAMEIFYLCSACLSRECSCVSHVLRPASFDDGDFLLCVVSSRLHARVPLGVLILCMVHAWPFGEPYSRLHAAFALCSFCLVLRVFIVERTLFFCCSCPLLRPIFLVFASPCSFYFYLPVTSTTYRGCFPVRLQFTLRVFYGNLRCVPFICSINILS
jgi:hypothetical protein